MSESKLSVVGRLTVNTKANPAFRIVTAAFGREHGITARQWVETEWTVDRAIDRLQTTSYEVVADRKRSSES